jgi:lipoate-protein ligase A
VPSVQFISEGLGSGPYNMDRDLELLNAAVSGGSACRLYGWDGPWVSLGRFQRAEEAVQPGFGNVVVRPTGGKAVLHGHDLTVALALPFSGRSVKDAYLAALQPLLRALEECGIRPRLGSSSTETPSEDCFATISPFDLVHRDTGSKIAGVAMRINRSALLLQASVPYALPLIDPRSAIRDAVAESVVEWNWREFESAVADALRTQGRQHGV